MQRRRKINWSIFFFILQITIFLRVSPALNIFYWARMINWWSSIPQLNHQFKLSLVILQNVPLQKKREKEEEKGFESNQCRLCSPLPSLLCACLCWCQGGISENPLGRHLSLPQQPPSSTWVSFFNRLHFSEVTFSEGFSRVTFLVKGSLSEIKDEGSRVLFHIEMKCGKASWSGVIRGCS